MLQPEASELDAAGRCVIGDRGHPGGECGFGMLLGDREQALFFLLGEDLARRPVLDQKREVKRLDALPEAAVAQDLGERRDLMIHAAMAGRVLPWVKMRHDARATRPVAWPIVTTYAHEIL